MKQRASITTLPLAPDVERRRRMIKYSVAMSVRVLCLISILFVHGWWMLIPAAGAIFLPYFAVVIANVSTKQTGGEVERPGTIVLARDWESGETYATAPRTGADDESADDESADDDDAQYSDDADVAEPEAEEGADTAGRGAAQAAANGPARGGAGIGDRQADGSDTV